MLILLSAHAPEKEAQKTVRELAVATDAQLPEQAQTLVEVLDWHAAQHPDQLQIHLYEEEEREHDLSFAELKAGAEAVAAGLVEGGLEPAQTVAMMITMPEAKPVALLLRSQVQSLRGVMIPAEFRPGRKLELHPRIGPGDIAFRDRFAKYGLRAGTIAPVYGLAESSVGLAIPPPRRARPGTRHASNCSTGSMKWR